MILSTCGKGKIDVTHALQRKIRKALSTLWYFNIRNRVRINQYNPHIPFSDIHSHCGLMLKVMVCNLASYLSIEQFVKARIWHMVTQINMFYLFILFVFQEMFHYMQYFDHFFTLRIWTIHTFYKTVKRIRCR